MALVLPLDEDRRVHLVRQDLLLGEDRRGHPQSGEHRRLDNQVHLLTAILVA